LLACASFDATVSIWRYDAAATNPDDAFEHVATLEGHEHEVKSVTWSMDGMFLASCSRDKTVWIWSRADPDDEENDEDWECVSVLSGHTQDVKRVAFSPIEHLLASASYDDTVRIWKDDGGRSDDWICEQTIQGHSSTVWDVCWDASGGKLATCSDDATVRIWERSSGWLSSAKQFRCVCTIGGIHDRPVYSVSWHPTECMLASASGDDSICIHEASSAPASAALAMDLTCRKLHAHTQDVNCVAWNPKDAALLASASDDGIVSLWSFGEQEPSPNPS
jgi:WD40 repeat protein